MEGANVTSLAWVRNCLCCRITLLNCNFKSQRRFSILDMYCIYSMTLNTPLSFVTLIDLVGIFLK